LAIALTGSTYQDFFDLFNQMGIATISRPTFHRHFRDYILPEIILCYSEKQRALIQELKNRGKPVKLVGDARFDSPGYSAKFCVYAVADAETGLIVDFHVAQLGEEANTSNALEGAAMEIVLNRLVHEGLDIAVFVTDRNRDVKERMKFYYEKFGILHRFDPWHFSKSIMKRIFEASKKSSCAILAEWTQPIGTHLWWAIENCGGSPDRLQQIFTSVLFHAADIHEFNEVEFPLFMRCAHQPFDAQERADRLWIDPTSKPWHELRQIILDPKLANDFPFLVGTCHTSSIENFFSMVLKYTPKVILLILLMIL
jgi:hypothetical protein